MFLHRWSLNAGGGAVKSLMRLARGAAPAESANLLAAVFAACAHGHRRQFMQTQLGAGIGMRRFLVTTQLVAGPREGL